MEVSTINLIDKLNKEVNSIKQQTNKFPLEILPEFYQELFDDLNEIMEFPNDFLGAGLFAAVSTVIGNKIRLQHKRGWQESASFYNAIVGLPGDGKSPALSFMMKPVEEIDRNLYLEYSSLLNEYNKLLDKENIPKPKLKQFLIDDATVEAVIVALDNNNKGITIYTDELNGFFRTLNRYRQGNDEQFYLSAYSNNTVKVNRVTKEQIQIENPNVNILGSIQPEILRSAFKETQIENGLIFRFLFYWPEHSKVLKWNSKELNEKLVEDYYEKIKAIFEFTESIDKVLLLEYEDEAKTKLHQWQNSQIESFESNFQRGAEIKLSQYVLRFSLVLHVIHNINVKGLPKYINSDMIKASIKLFDYFKENAMRVLESFNANEYDKLTRNAKTLYDLLPETFKTGEGLKIALNKKLMSERGFKNFLNKEALFVRIKHGEYSKNLL